jgi:hypothetical protein
MLSESVAQDCAGSSGTNQLRSICRQHGHLGPGYHGLLDSTLDEHLGRRPAQCGLRTRAEHSGIEDVVGAHDQVAGTVTICRSVFRPAISTGW